MLQNNENNEIEFTTKHDLISNIPSKVKSHLQLQNSGHIISFVTKVDIENNFKCKKAICFKMEFPDKDLFAVNCFARLFTSNIAYILKDFIKIPISVEGLDIIATAEHKNFNIIQKDGIVNMVKIFKDGEIGCIMIFLYLNSGEFQGVNPRAFSLNDFLTEDKILGLTKRIEESYYYLTKEIAKDCWKGNSVD